MRKIKLLGAAFLLLISCSKGLAQQKQAPAAPARCATDEAIARSFREHPELKAEYDRKNAETAQQRGNETGRVSTLTGPVTIPVIVHVVTGNPDLITEAQIDYFINRLNLDFSGRNPDSANGAPFYGVRGHSLLRFTRARRTPGGQITSGIERRVSTTLTIAGNTYQPIKHASAGGLDPWDVTQYYNLWVGDGGPAGLLGIAPAIGVGNQTETTTSAVGIDGVCVDYRAFSNGCFDYNIYNLARTAVHEIGHNFGLYHTFTGCAAGADFAQPTPAGQTLPANLVGAVGDDTPGLSTATTNCPTGTVASNCAGVPNPPGKMYQDYMDYTADACYSMFTVNQVARMEYMLETYRPGYLTTQGALPPANFPTVDAAISSIVSPGGSVLNDVVGNCTVTNYPTPNCPGAVTPRLLIQNTGATTLTSVTITMTLAGATTGTTTTTVALSNLPTNGTQVVTLPNITLPVGTTTITFTITQANGVADTYTANNTLSTAATIALSNLPFTQDFTGTTFPPANMSIFNPNGNFTWIRNANGNGNVGSAFIDNYNNSNPGQIDDIRTIPFTPPAGLGPNDSLVITFDVAHKNYPGSFDILSVLVSNNCGTTFTSVYSKSGATLATAGSSTGSYLTPIASDWRKERVSIGGALLTGGPIIVAFRNTNDYGNNIFLDNINIVRKFDRDLSVTAIISPAAVLCTNTFTPQVAVTNNGATAIDTFSVGYTVNGGTAVSQRFIQRINPNATATLNLAAATVNQSSNVITVFTFNPANSAGSGDQQTRNDTLSKSFSAPANIPLVEGFETLPFPPSGWTTVGGTAAFNWVRVTPGHNSSWSAKVDNYNNTTLGQNISLQTLPLRTTNLDSVIVTFDVAYREYDNTYTDILQVLASRDCGGTFTSYYNKSGSTLATASPTTADYTPTQQQWRTERVSIPFTALNTGSTIIRFQNTNGNGNNLFIDNINITGIYKRDAQLLSINQPANVICNTANTPSVTIRNVGTDTIKSFKVAYVVDNGTPVVTNFASVNIVKNTNLTVALTALTTTVGVHSFRAYVYDLVTNTGAGDQRTQNDTLSKTFSVVNSVAAPLVEGFESTSFPPTGWAVVNPDGATTWQRTTTVSYTGTASAYITNRSYTGSNNRDELYTPQISYGSVDSVFLSFDVAAATYNYPGSAEIPLDTLELLVTNDCGTSFTSIYKKWGNDLQTVRDPNFAQTDTFLPTTRNQWRNEQINLSAYASRSPIQVVFRNTANHGNNIFIDNVNVSTKTLPAQLKEQGYLIYPSPFTSTFNIQHYLSPTELRGIAVYNSVGQRVWAKEYGTSGATSLMQVDMSRYANDIYTVVLRYTNRTVSQKVIKVN